MYSSPNSNPQQVPEAGAGTAAVGLLCTPSSRQPVRPRVENGAVEGEGPQGLYNWLVLSPLPLVWTQLGSQVLAEAF